MAALCNATSDDLAVWPSTMAGTIAVALCPQAQDHLEELLADTGSVYDLAERPPVLQLSVAPPANATRLCMANGTWDPFVNYTQCMDDVSDALTKIDSHFGYHIPAYDDKISLATIIGHIYLAGGVLSALSVSAALAVFCTFRRLHCLRNYIHMQLMASSLIKLILWFIIYEVLRDKENVFAPFCSCVGVLLVYSSVCQFTWMFIEALNIVIVVVRAMVPSSVPLKPLLLIGWGSPFLVAIGWIAFNAYNSSYQPGICWLPHYVRNKAFSGDLIYAIPMFLLLLANLILLGIIIHILISKQRYKPLTSCTRQTIKATFVLVPLLGVNHVLWAYPPDDMFTLQARILLIVNAVLQSTQGFWVALFYCFMNGEVKGTLAAKTRYLKENWTPPIYLFGKKKCVYTLSELSPHHVQRSAVSDLLFLSSQPSEGSTSNG